MKKKDGTDDSSGLLACCRPLHKLWWGYSEYLTQLSTITPHCGHSSAAESCETFASLYHNGCTDNDTEMKKYTYCIVKIFSGQEDRSFQNNYWRHRSLKWNIEFYWERVQAFPCIFIYFNS